jgi:hypothetical protein
MKLLKIICLILLMVLSFNDTNSRSYGTNYKYMVGNSGRIYAIRNIDETSILPDSVLYALTGHQRKHGVLVKMRDYIDKIGYLESRGNYSVTNQFGYMGKYQFGKKTLRGLGYTKKQIKTFLKDSDLQEEAMLKLIEHNLEILKNYGLMKYVGYDVNGVSITVEGMLAGSHLLGPHAVKQFIKKGKIGRDGNGTTIVTYMKQFI